LPARATRGIWRSPGRCGSSDPSPPIRHPAAARRLRAVPAAPTGGRGTEEHLRRRRGW
jgi:hypothetical protein